MTTNETCARCGIDIKVDCKEGTEYNRFLCVICIALFEEGDEEELIAMLEKDENQLERLMSMFESGGGDERP